MTEQDVDDNSTFFKFYSFHWTINNFNMLSSKLESPPFMVGNGDENEWIMCLNTAEGKLRIEISVINDGMELIKDNCFNIAVLDEGGKVLKSEYGYMLELPNSVTREEGKFSFFEANVSERKTSNDMEVNSSLKSISKLSIIGSAEGNKEQKIFEDNKSCFFKTPTFLNNEFDTSYSGLNFSKYKNMPNNATRTGKTALDTNEKRRSRKALKAPRKLIHLKNLGSNGSSDVDFSKATSRIPSETGLSNKNADNNVKVVRETSTSMRKFLPGKTFEKQTASNINARASGITIERNQQKWITNKRVFREVVDLGCSSSYIRKNTLYLHCNLGLKLSYAYNSFTFLNIRSEMQDTQFPTITSVPENIETLSKDLECIFLKNASFSDILSKVNCNNFTAHKALLHCRCPRLLDNLAGHLQEFNERKANFLFDDSEMIKFCVKDTHLNNEGNVTIKMAHCDTSHTEFSKKKSRFSRKVVNRLKYQRSIPSDSFKDSLVSPDSQEKLDLTSNLNSLQSPCSSSSLTEVFTNQKSNHFDSNYSDNTIFAKECELNPIYNNDIVSHDSELLYAIESDGKLVLVNDEVNCKYNVNLDEVQLINETDNFYSNGDNLSSCKELDYTGNDNAGKKYEYNSTAHLQNCDKNEADKSSVNSKETEDRISLKAYFAESNHERISESEHVNAFKWEENESNAETEYHSFSQISEYKGDEKEMVYVKQDSKPFCGNDNRLEYDYTLPDVSVKSRNLLYNNQATEILKPVTISSDSLHSTDTNSDYLSTERFCSKSLSSDNAESYNFYLSSVNAAKHFTTKGNSTSSEALADFESVHSVDFVLDKESNEIRGKSDDVLDSNKYKSHDSFLCTKKYSPTFKNFQFCSQEKASCNSSLLLSNNEYSNASKSQQVNSEGANISIPLDEDLSRCDCSEILKITDIDPHVFFWILRYIYSGRLDLHNQFLFKFTCFRVYNAALKFGLTDLVTFLAPMTMHVKSRVNVEKFSFSAVTDKMSMSNFSWRCVTKSQSKIIFNTLVTIPTDIPENVLVCKPSFLAFGSENLRLNSKIQYTISLTLLQKHKKIFLKPKTQEHFISNEVYLPEVWFELDKETDIKNIDSMSIQCNFTLEGDCSTEEIERIYPISISELNSMNLSRDLRTLFMSQKYSDICLQVNDQNFHAHRFILSARSSEFDRMLKNCPRNVITLENLDPETLENLLLYIYTGEVSDSNKGLLLYKAAIHFCLKDLENMCQKYMIDHMDKIDTCQVLIYTQSYCDKLLEKAAEDYVCRNASKTLLSKSGLYLMQNYPSIAERVLQKLSIQK